MNFRYLSNGFAAVVMVASCSSPLAKSKTDQKMRYQGSFSCQNTSLEPATHSESVAEADVARVRCAKDEWKIEGERVFFTRALFQSKKCENLLGKIVFESTYQILHEKLVVNDVHCKLLRISNGWIGENPQCMLHQIDLNTPYSVEKVFACSPYVPKGCKGGIQPVSLESVEPTDAGHLAFDAVIVKASSSSQTSRCNRYAGE